MPCFSTFRMIADEDTSAVDGRLRWAPAKSLWITTMTLLSVVFAPLTFRVDAVLLFLATTMVTLWAGHSVGMHRLIVHRSFSAPVWVAHVLVYLGTLVGMAGPFGMIRIHDTRDWAQRQSACHDLFAHRFPFLKDAFLQMHCALQLDHPPKFVIEPHIRNDRFYRFLERTWMLQQLPWAVLFYLLGGWSWVIWGVPVRIAVSLTGHWLVVRFTHRGSDRPWQVDGAAVQGVNIGSLSLITFGESWHSNHHAYPESARMGIGAGQPDPGWWLIRLLQSLGLAYDVKQPADLAPRAGLKRAVSAGQETRKDRRLLGCGGGSCWLGRLAGKLH